MKDTKIMLRNEVSVPDWDDGRVKVAKKDGDKDDDPIVIDRLGELEQVVETPLNPKSV